MQKEHTELLSLKEYYQIISTKTKKPYMDSSFSCYLFSKRMEAQQFVEKVGDVEIQKAATIRPKLFCEFMYTSGFQKIRVLEKGEYVDIPTEKPEYQKGLYNHYTEALLSRLKQTGGKVYLRGLYGATFYTPVLLDQRRYGAHPIIHYSYATIKDGRYYLLFSSIDNFNKWAQSQTTKWKPMEVTIAKFDRIRLKNPIIINPHSDKIGLTESQIKIIMEGKKDGKKKPDTGQ